MKSTSENSFHHNYLEDKFIKTYNKIKSIIHVLPNYNPVRGVKYLARHNSFKYLNRGALTEIFFNKAYKEIADENIYILITKSNSTAGHLIGLFTHKEYNHVSISFDKNLETIISYNGGNDIGSPGLNMELLGNLIKNENSSILVYRLHVNSKQQRRMIEEIRKINEEGSSYNILGLIFNKSFKRNIMFCSQFVYSLLCNAGIDYFEVSPSKVKPSDFVEFDYYRKLEFMYKIDYDKKSREMLL